MKGEDKIRLAFDNAAPADGDGEGGNSRELRLARKSRNDSGNGERYRDRHGRNLMYVPHVGRFFYTGSYWSVEVGDQQWALAAAKTAQNILDETAALKAETIPLPGSVGVVDLKAHEKWVHGLQGWAVESGNRRRLEAMQAVSEPFLTKRIEELDANPFLFNVQNGTLELGQKGDRAAVRLRRHVRRDLIARIAPVGFDANAECPLFRAFIGQVLPDPDVQRWVQKFFGYSLTGVAREHILVLFLGDGRNGKGTLVRVFLWLFGDYAATIAFASLAADDRRRGSEASPDIARLPGVRLLFAAEPRKGVRLDDGRIKELTGEDRQVARHLNRGIFEFDPQFKLVIQANNRPRIKDTSRGMWERVRLVPFDVVIPEKLRDQDLLHKLKAEGPGVLNWALDGYRLWCEEGLAAPTAIMAATAKYRGESDDMGRFLSMATIVDPAGSIRSAALYACYRGWARAMDLEPMSQTKFGTELTDRGYVGGLQGSERLMWRVGLRWSDAIDWDWEAPR